MVPSGVEDLGSMTAASRWHLLKKGVNNILVAGTAINDGKVAMTGYSYRETWWGV